MGINKITRQASAKVKKENMNREINIDLSIIIPIHNEEKKIEEDLKKIFRYFDSQIYNYEVICVNDGSKDNTLDVLKNINKTKKNIGNLKIISYSKNRGKGYAVKKGVLNPETYFFVGKVQNNRKIYDRMYGKWWQEPKAKRATLVDLIMSWLLGA